MLPEGQILPVSWCAGMNVGGGQHTSVMAREIPSTLSYLAHNQSGVVSRSQALRVGPSPGMIKFRVRSGRWRQDDAGVYATFTES